jgi:cobalt/nickel transport system permease protein
MRGPNRRALASLNQSADHSTADRCLADMLARMFDIDDILSCESPTPSSLQSWSGDMHIPGGFLTNPVCALTTATAAAAVGTSVWQMRRSFDARSARPLAATGAAIFAAQMLNFPIASGTSGHLVGAAAAAIVLGPWAATLAMAVVLATQATLFGDGSLATLGANLLSMGIVAPWTAWGVYRCVIRETESSASNGQRSLLVGSTLAGFVSILAAATVCSLELAAAGKVALGDVLPAMLQTHLAVALSEALLTVGIVLAWSGYRGRNIRKRGLNPANSPAGGAQNSRAALAILGLSLGVALLLAPWASTAPDGLETVAQRLGFAHFATASFAALAPDYVLTGLGDLPLAIGLAGLIGVAGTFAAGYVIACSAACRAAKR